MKENRKIGICMGSSTISMVVRQNGSLEMFQKRHSGNPKKVLFDLLEKHSPSTESTVVITGRTKIGKFISEPIAVQAVLDKTEKTKLPGVIVNFGGQSIMAYEIDSNGRIIESHTFNKCGSGTGEFFLQQIGRMGVTEIEEAILLAKEPDSSEKPCELSSRCSVFCKSDITHKLNEKKATPGQIVAGFCKMIAEKIHELIAKIDSKSVWVIGGGSNITPVIDYLKSFNLEVTVPKHATYFEAYGASLIAGEDSLVQKIPEITTAENEKSFPTLPPLSTFANLVINKKVSRVEPENGEKVLLSVDVGSTTTKMVLCRVTDLAIVASYYGYTLGKPNEAVSVGLKEIQKNLNVPVVISGIVVTGSGRYLVEAFLTDFSKKDGKEVLKQAVALNEILCHAKAAEHLNPGVSVVLEIGGQDAKYTYLSNGVAIDYCMNEACSAGTGSFLAEVVAQLFGISDPSKIAPIATEGASPLKFGEQCSAFIESDIAKALAEGSSESDIIAGLCYSICYNYLNRVVGNRPINGTISVQGGTAYNQAFCLAMAGVLKMSGMLGDDNKIVVSGDAGLMGAIGGAVEMKRMLETGDFSPIETTLEALLKKELVEGKSFTCKRCDYSCEVRNFVIDGNKIPFGGYCRYWENVRKGQKIVNPDENNFVNFRDKQLFGLSDFGQNLPDNAKSIGMLGTFFDLTYLPFYTNLFVNLGYKPVLADEIDKDGELRQGAEFCWPVEVAHGLLANLIKKNPDFYWLPHLKAPGEENEKGKSSHSCPFVQGIPYILGTAFANMQEEKILKPYLDFSFGINHALEQLLTLKNVLGFSENEFTKAAQAAWEKQEEFFVAIKSKGGEMLEWLSEDKSRVAFVLVGRPYNAFSAHLNLNKGIAMKIASMDIPIIPVDFLPYNEEELEENMYWGTGQMILRGAKYITKNPQLFPVFLTNFSCGPDSFIVNKFREYMENKPSLILEFDGHTANAGFDTRIEAFISIVRNYFSSEKTTTKKKAFKPAEVVLERGKTYVFDSLGKRFTLNDPRVHLIFPDMGDINAQAMAAVTTSMGVRSTALPSANSDDLALGRRWSSCKECIPYNLTLGSLLSYVDRRNKNELTVFFMPDTTGPCRFGQYNIFIKNVIEKLELENVAVITLTTKNGYSGLGAKFAQRSWIAVCVGMTFMNMRNTLKTLAIDPVEAENKLEEAWKDIKLVLEKGIGFQNFSKLRKLLSKKAHELSSIKLKRSFAETPKVLITGEIYARVSKLTTDPLVEYLSQNGIIPIFEPILNWFKYEDEMILQGFSEGDYKKMGLVETQLHKLKIWFENHYEHKIVKTLSSSGLVASHTDDIRGFLTAAEPYFSKMLTGEAILTLGSALHEVFENYAGIAVLGPFGCMPSRMASSILQHKMTAEVKVMVQPDNLKIVTLSEEFSRCPVAFVETDGGPLSFITLSKLEAFSMVVKNVGERMAEIEK